MKYITISLTFLTALIFSSCVPCMSLDKEKESTIAHFQAGSHKLDKFCYLNNKTERYLTTSQNGRDEYQYLRRGAKQFFHYALMASNTYSDGADPAYEILDWERGDRYASCSGLDFDLYYKGCKKEPKEIVIAFRGTQGTKDWFSGNLSLIPSKQTIEAKAFALELKSQHPESIITAVGHSLGGGLAISVSQKVDGINAVAFNSSPRVVPSYLEWPINDNNRVHIYESGEFLASALISRYSLNFFTKNYTPYKFNEVDFKWQHQLAKEHSMYRLSRTLLICACAQKVGELPEETEYARRIFEYNLGSKLDEAWVGDAGDTCSR